jgi:TolA-binding protein
MKRFCLFLLASFGALACAVSSPAFAQCGGGGVGQDGGSEGPKCPSEALGGRATDFSEMNGLVYWIESAGQGAPEVTSVYDDPKAAKDRNREIQEIEKAREDLKPVLVFFCKPRDPLAFGDKAAKDPEVAACEALDNALWKRLAIAERSREFVCVRVSLAGADPALVRKHGVSRAPVVEILDLDLRQAHFSVSPSADAASFARTMDAALEKAEKEIRRLAKLEEDTPRVRKAKERAQEFTQRSLYQEGLKFLDKPDWARAEAKFRDALALPAATDWRERARVALVEAEAGRELQKAEALCKDKRYREAEQALERILSECKEAKYFGAKVSEKLDWVRKKMEKDK